MLNDVKLWRSGSFISISFTTFKPHESALHTYGSMDTHTDHTPHTTPHIHHTHTNTHIHTSVNWVIISLGDGLFSAMSLLEPMLILYRSDFQKEAWLLNPNKTIFIFTEDRYETVVCKTSAIISNVSYDIRGEAKSFCIIIYSIYILNLKDLEDTYETRPAQCFWNHVESIWAVNDGLSNPPPCLCDALYTAAYVTFGDDLIAVDLIKTFKLYFTGIVAVMISCLPQNRRNTPENMVKLGSHTCIKNWG